MSVIGKNTTYLECSICLKNYGKYEVTNTEKVIEVACGHFFHIKCVEPWNIQLERTGIPLKCGYCNQIYAEPIKPTETGIYILKDQDSFKSSLEDLKKIYKYDHIALEAFIQVSKMFDNFSEILKNLDQIKTELEITEEELDGFFIQDMKTLVFDHKDINDRLKPEVMYAIGAIVSQDSCLRTLEGESRRWIGTPLDQFPKQIRKDGCLVSIGEYRVRVSANYLYRSASKILADDVVHKLDLDAEYINAIPGRIIRHVYNLAANFFGYFMPPLIDRLRYEL